jgi:hypothetical protein
VIKSSGTLFNGTVLGVDEWEALCKKTKRLLDQRPWRAGRDRHVANLPRVVGGKQHAVT